MLPNVAIASFEPPNSDPNATQEAPSQSLLYLSPRLSLYHSMIFLLQSLARYKYEEDHQSGIDHEEDGKDCQSTLGQQPFDEWFSNTCKVHESILAVAGKCNQRIDAILMGGKGVDSNGKWKNQLLWG